LFQHYAIVTFRRAISNSENESTWLKSHH